MVVSVCYSEFVDIQKQSRWHCIQNGHIALYGTSISTWFNFGTIWDSPNRKLCYNIKLLSLPQHCRTRVILFSFFQAIVKRTIITPFSTVMMIASRVSLFVCLYCFSELKRTSNQWLPIYCIEIISYDNIRHKSARPHCFEAWGWSIGSKNRTFQRWYTAFVSKCVCFLYRVLAKCIDIWRSVTSDIWKQANFEICQIKPAQ